MPHSDTYTYAVCRVIMLSTTIKTIMVNVAML
jgi:hypothetical protein